MSQCFDRISRFGFSSAWKTYCVMIIRGHEVHGKSDRHTGLDVEEGTSEGVVSTIRELCFVRDGEGQWKGEQVEAHGVVFLWSSDDAGDDHGVHVKGNHDEDESANCTQVLHDADEMRGLRDLTVSLGDETRRSRMRTQPEDKL